MDHSIVSLLALSTECNAAVYAFNVTTFRLSRPATHTVHIPVSVAAQAAAGRTISDIGILDLTTLPSAWASAATDESDFFTPRNALIALSRCLSASETIWLPEYDVDLPILHSLYQMYIPERNCPFDALRTADLGGLVSDVTRDSDHQGLATAISLLVGTRRRGEQA
jgi:hypothetical protein